MRIVRYTLVILFLLSLSFVVPYYVAAVGEYATGGTAASGSTSTGDTHFDCYSARACPRWIKVSNSIYKDIISKKRWVGDYDGLSSVCQNDQSVIIAGNQAYSSGFLQVYNLVNNSLSHYKTDRGAVSTNTWVSIATGDSSDKGGFTITNYKNAGPNENFFYFGNDDGLRGGSDNHVLTYGEILNEVMRQSGESEESIAAFCPSMIATNVTLTAYAVTAYDSNQGHKYLTTEGSVTDYQKTPPSNAYKVSSAPVLSGTSASVTMDSTKGNYEWKEWGSSCGDETGETPNDANRTCTVNPLNSNKTVYAYYKLQKRTLSGKAIVNKIRNGKCTIMSSYNPNSVTVDYGSPASISKKNITNLEFKGWSTTKNETTNCPGAISNTSGSYSVNYLTNNTEVYAVYEPIAIPCSGNDNNKTESACGSTINIKQSKTNNSGWTTNVLYMKPGDKVYLKGSFKPEYQDQKESKPQKVKLKSEGSYSNNSNTLSAYLFGKKKSNWNNAFSIVSDGVLGSKSGTIGSNTEYSNDNDIYYTTKLGTTNTAQVKTNQVNLMKFTLKGIDFSYDSEYNLQANMDDSNAESNTVTTITPYNFTNTTEITTDPGTVYAGETKGIEYSFNINDKENSLVGDTYHTAVPGAYSYIKVVHYYANGNKVPEGERTTAKNNLGTINDGDSYKETINIMDLPAGSRVCVTSYIYPSNSGGDDNISVDNFGGETHGDEVCFTIAKKPSFQVWGGGLYSANNIDLSPAPAIKNNLAGYDGYNATGISNIYTFGSFTELGITATGSIKGLASGAATGYSNKGLDANPGGFSGSYDYCKLSPLTVPNNNCSNGSVGTNTTNNANNTNTTDRSSLISRFTNDTETNEALKNYTVVDLSDCDGVECEIGGGELDGYDGDKDESGVTRYTKVINVKGKDLTITGNITYNKDQTYENLDQIPKIIIYAKNIKIQCSVTQIDAVLIADEDINTCSDANEDVNDIKRSNRLQINGSIITGTLHLERTYGAATGNNSIEPAEIINYDSSLYLWANGQAASRNTGRLTTTYIHDLPPRY